MAVEVAAAAAASQVLQEQVAMEVAAPELQVALRGSGLQPELLPQVQQTGAAVGAARAPDELPLVLLAGLVSSL
jgi:hypothetical protein